MKKARKGVRYGTMFFIVVATAILASIATYFYVSVRVANLSRNQQFYAKLNKVNDLIEKHYILDIDLVSGNDKILDSVIEGYIDGLDDPYAYYLNETNYRLSSNAAVASEVDIGIRTAFDKESGGVLVDFVKRNSPAEEAGIETGDIITAVGGDAVVELGYRNAVSMLSGVEGTDVVLTLQRHGETAPITLSVARKTFDPKTVSYRLLESGDGIGYIYINEFALSTVSEFSAAVESLRDLGARGFIIDVRFNAGGDFTAMTQVLDKIMPAGIMCSVQDLSSDTATLYDSKDDHLPEKIVVLQNRFTSDVAEVFVAALQDTMTTSLVGDTTFGKGVGQRDIPLSDGTAIHISTYEYITPDGKEFNGIGIVPDVSVSLSEEKILGFDTLTAAEDDQLQAALTSLRSLLGIS